MKYRTIFRRSVWLEGAKHTVAVYKHGQGESGGMRKSGRCSLKRKNKLTASERIRSDSYTILTALVYAVFVGQGPACYLEVASLLEKHCPWMAM